MSLEESANNYLNKSSKNLNNKEVLINQLKTQIFDLEQKARDYSTLQTKCKQLANQVFSLSEEKNRLEFELKQKAENDEKIIYELQSEKENLENTLNEKLETNKTLYNDNNNLFSSLESKNKELENMEKILSENKIIQNNLEIEKTNLENLVNELEEKNKKNEIEIQKLNEEIEELNLLCEKKEDELAEFNNDKKNFEEKINILEKKLEEEMQKNKDVEIKQKLDLLEAIYKKDKEIEELKLKISRFPFELNEGEKLISVIFTTIDETIYHSIICKNTDKFSKVEDKFYEYFHEYSKSQNIFRVNGMEVNKYKSLGENKIVNSDIIILNNG